MASKPSELKAIAWRGPLTPALAAGGINAAIRNARRLLNDATTLYKVGSFPSATALGILAIEEYGKVNIIHQILLAKTDLARKKLWRKYTSHTAKNTAWVMPNLLKSGARSVDDFRMLFEKDAKHQYVLDDFKQWGLYTECRGTAWSEPVQNIQAEMAIEVLNHAHALITPLPEFSEERMEVYVKHLSPVWTEHNEDADTTAIRNALADYYKECQQRGWMRQGVDPHDFFKARDNNASAVGNGTA
jgi:AbiV family abortive infection protein